MKKILLMMTLALGINQSIQPGYMANMMQYAKPTMSCLFSGSRKLAGFAAMGSAMVLGDIAAKNYFGDSSAQMMQDASQAIQSNSQVIQEGFNSIRVNLNANQQTNLQQIQKSFQANQQNIISGVIQAGSQIPLAFAQTEIGKDALLLLGAGAGKLKEIMEAEKMNSTWSGWAYNQVNRTVSGIAAQAISAVLMMAVMTAVNAAKGAMNHGNNVEEQQGHEQQQQPRLRPARR